MENKLFFYKYRMLVIMFIIFIFIIPSYVCSGTRFTILREDRPRTSVDLYKTKSHETFSESKSSSSQLDHNFCYSTSNLFEPILDQPSVPEEDFEVLNQDFRNMLSGTQEKILQSVMDLFTYYNENIPISNSRELELRQIVSTLGEDAGPFKNMLDSEIEYNQYIKCISNDQKSKYLFDLLKKKRRYDIIDQIDYGNSPMIINQDDKNHSVTIMYKVRGEINSINII